MPKGCCAPRPTLPPPTRPSISSPSWRGHSRHSSPALAIAPTVAFENDATAAAFAEAAWGAGRGVKDVFVVSLGTGIGAGIFAAGRAVRGAHGYAGELGHMIIDPDGPECPCGRRGCFERFASGSGLAFLATAGRARGATASRRLRGRGRDRRGARRRRRGARGHRGVRAVPGARARQRRRTARPGADRARGRADAGRRRPPRADLLRRLRATLPPGATSRAAPISCPRPSARRPPRSAPAASSGWRPSTARRSPGRQPFDSAISRHVGQSG